MLHSKDIEWQIGFKKARTCNMLPTRDSLQGERHTQTESEGMGKDISCKRQCKESGGSNTHNRQNRL